MIKGNAVCLAYGLDTGDVKDMRPHIRLALGRIVDWNVLAIGLAFHGIKQYLQ